MRKYWIVGLLFIGLFLLAGCDGTAPVTPTAVLPVTKPAPGVPDTADSNSESASDPVSDTAYPAPGNPADDTTNTDPAASDIDFLGDAVIVFERSGGFAGISETWRIYHDGRIEGNSGQRYQITPEQVTAVLTLAETNGFSRLDNSYVPKDTCCDRFFYGLSVQQGDFVKTVSTIDAAPEQPEALTELLTAVQRLIQGAYP